MAFSCYTDFIVTLLLFYVLFFFLNKISQWNIKSLINFRLCRCKADEDSWSSYYKPFVRICWKAQKPVCFSGLLVKLSRKTSCDNSTYFHRLNQWLHEMLLLHICKRLLPSQNNSVGGGWWQIYKRWWTKEFQQFLEFKMKWKQFLKNTCTAQDPIIFLPKIKPSSKQVSKWVSK